MYLIKQTELFSKWLYKLKDIQGDEIIVLLVGGDKSTQSKDIEKAKELLKEFDDE